MEIRINSILSNDFFKSDFLYKGTWYYLVTSVILINLAKNFSEFQGLANSRHYDTCLIEKYAVMNLANLGSLEN